jgi:uncharacterized protein (TIGR02598 family)
MKISLKFEVEGLRLEQEPNSNRIPVISHNFKPQTSNLKPSAFTLIEVVLAIGIMSFALVGILGLFPVALETAQDSKAETQIALLAQRIEADLRSLQQSGVDGTGNPTWTARVFNGPSGTNATSAADYQNINLLATSASTLTLAYVRDANLELVPKGSTVSTGEYTSGVNGAEFLARITTQYNTPEHPNLCTVLITLETPGNAPETARKKQTFFTLMGQR